MLAIRLPSLTPEIKQIYAACGPILLHFSYAYMTGIQTILLVKLRQTDSDLQLTPVQESLFVTIPILVLLSSQCFAGILTPKYGRKIIICLSILPNFLACIIAGFALNFTNLLLAFMISGLSGAGISLGPIMIAETCSKGLRAITLNLRMAFYFAGLAVVVLLGKFFSWRTLAFYGFVPNFISLVISLTIPESPVWFASKGKFIEFKSAFLWYRDNSDTEEIDQLIESKVDIFRNNKVQGTSLKRKIVISISDRGLLKAISISFLCIFIYFISGKQILSKYAIDSVSSVCGGSNLHYIYFAINVLDSISLFVSCIFLSKYKRRSMIFLSAVSSLFMLLVFCFLTFIASKGHISSNLSFFPLIFISLYFVFLNLGVFPVLFTLQTEVFSLSNRGLGIVVTSFIFLILELSIAKITPILEMQIGIHGVLTLNAVIISLALICFYFVVPETFDKTMLEISKLLQYNVVTMEDFDDETLSILQNLDVREKLLACPYPVSKY